MDIPGDDVGPCDAENEVLGTINGVTNCGGVELAGIWGEGGLDPLGEGGVVEDGMVGDDVEILREDGGVFCFFSSRILLGRVKVLETRTKGDSECADLCGVREVESADVVDVGDVKNTERESRLTLIDEDELRMELLLLFKGVDCTEAVGAWRPLFITLSKSISPFSSIETSMLSRDSSTSTVFPHR